MSSTSWADIQRLAADLQRIQLAEGSKRLTESNCVEVVSILISRGLVDLVISADGKEYISRKHLQRECANECLAAGGRSALTEMASQLNIDLDHVNTAVGQLLKQSQQQLEEEQGEMEEGEEGGGEAGAEFVVCAGELLHRNFLNELCARLDTRLQDLGHLSMLQLTRQWELPTELLNQHILPQLGTQPGARICAIRFEDQLCTVRYIGALRAKLRAILIGLTKPSALANVHAHLGISQNLFFQLWNELAEEGKLPGKLLGGKNSLKSLYVPDVHERMAKLYVKQRLAEDHFIENSLLKRLSIASEPSVFLRDLMPAKEYQDLLFWPSVVLSESRLWRECDSLAKNLLQSNHFCLLEDILPAQFTFLADQDLARVVERLQQHCNGANLRATEERSVVYEEPQLMQSWLKAVDSFIRESAIKDAPELRKAQLNAALQAKQKQQKGTTAVKEKAIKEEDSWEMDKPGKKGGKAGKKGAGGAGTGTGGGAARSGKQKGGEPSTDSVADPISSAQLSPKELHAELTRQLPAGFEIPSALWAHLEEDFCSAANKIYRNGLAEAWQQLAETGGEQQEMRKAYEGRVAKLGEAFATICMFDKGAEAFEEALANDLHAYLLRSLCSELATSLVLALADPTSQQLPGTISTKQREQLIGTLESAEMQKRARAMFEPMETMESFLEAVQRLTSLAGIQLKKPDKRERMERLATLGTELGTQLAACSDPPTFLLLTVLLALHRFHGLAVHASGKFVSPLIDFLATSKCSTGPQADQPFPPELGQLLNETQRLVVASIKQKGGEQSGSIQDKLAEKMDQIMAFFEEKQEEKE